MSAGMMAPLVGRASSRGAQLFGTARTLERDVEGERYWEAFRWRSDHAEQVSPERTADGPADDPYARPDLVHRALATPRGLPTAPPGIASSASATSGSRSTSWPLRC